MKEREMKTTKPENFRKWLDALRSGEYKQGRGTLRSDNNFCCLGVACDIAKEDLGIDWGIVQHSSEMTFDKEVNLLPVSVKDWLGIDYPGGNILIGENNYPVTAINDRWAEGDFGYIADALEREYL